MLLDLLQVYIIGDGEVGDVGIWTDETLPTTTWLDETIPSTTWTDETTPSTIWTDEVLT